MYRISKLTLTLFLAFFVTNNTQAIRVPEAKREIVINVQRDAAVSKIEPESKIKTFFKKHWVKIAIATSVTIVTCAALYYIYSRTHTPPPTFVPDSKPNIGPTNNNNIDPKDIRMVSITTNGRESFASIAEKSQRAYAKEHGYSYAIYKDSPSYSAKTDLANKVPAGWACSDRAHTLPEEWLKISAVNQQLQDPNVKWVLWMDDDMYITDPKKTLESFIKQYGDKNLIIARDPYSGAYNGYSKILFNNGIFLLKNNQESKDFLKRSWELGVCNKGYTSRGSSLLEQQSMTDVYLQDPVVRKNTQILKTRDLNSIIRFDSYNDRDKKKWQYGDFVAHVTGVCTKLREAVFGYLHSVFRNGGTASPIRVNEVINSFRANGKTLYCPGDNR